VTNDKTGAATCDGCNKPLPSDGKFLCEECAKMLDALSEHVKQRYGKKDEHDRHEI